MLGICWIDHLPTYLLRQLIEFVLVLASRTINRIEFWYISLCIELLDRGLVSIAIKGRKEGGELTYGVLVYILIYIENTSTLWIYSK